MAQYFQVLSQAEKSSAEELRDYYPNIINNSSQSVQYVIRPNEQTFQGSPIIVSSDQLMVVEGPPQQLIVDQSQVTFPSQYILQDTNIEFREGQTQQQIYYMDDTSAQQVESVQAEQVPQTIVLNHQLPGTQVLGQINSNIVAPKIVMSLQRQNQINPLPQQVKQDHPPIPQPRQVVHHRLPNVLTANRAMTPQKSTPPPPMAQNTTRVATPIVKGRKSVSDSLHFTSNLPNRPAQQQTEMGDGDKNTSRFIKTNAASSKKGNQANQIQQSNRLSGEFEQGMTSCQNRVVTTTPQQQPKKRANRNSTPRSNNRGANKNAKAGTAKSNHVATPKPQPTHRQPRPMNRLNVPHQQTAQVRMPQPLLQQPQINMPTPQQVHSPQYVIQPHAHHNPQPPIGLPPYVPSNQIKKIIESTPLTEEYTDSIRMLVLLSTGEQRLITFTLPKEQCTIQEILEQVGVQIEHDTKIECNETNINGINYIVTVTMSQHMSQNQVLEDSSEVEEPSFQSSSGSSSTSIVQQRQPSPIPEPPPKPTTPEPPKELPRYVQGMLALCSHCGYLSEDFNKCLRCKRKLPEDVKAIAAVDQSAVKKMESKNFNIATSTPTPSPALTPSSSPEKQGKATPAAPTKSNGASKSNSTSSTNRGGSKRGKGKSAEQETICVLSSDDEDDTSKQTTVTTLKIVEPQLMPEIKKEPSLSEIKKCDNESICDKSIKDDNTQYLCTTINCRTIRIGSYRFVPTENIIVNSNEIIMKVPLPTIPKEVKTIKIEREKIVKVLANFQKILPVIFYYLTPSCGDYVREQLNMTSTSDYYFDPISTEEANKRITILPELFGDETKLIFKQIYGQPRNIMEELSAKEANNILLRTCPKEVTKAIGIPQCFTAEIKQLLIYPPGKGGLPINTEDYLCLAQDQFLNDVIIDFYLKYLVLNLPVEDQEKVHVFSTFFYKRLTTKPLKASRKAHPSETDASLTPAQKRHARVKTWTKNVNLFEKDYIIVPINESCHWFLAIICFPGMEGCYTFDGKPVKLEAKQKRKKTAGITSLGNVTITHVKIEKPEMMPCEDGEISDKDEAEGDDSELESDDDTEEIHPDKVPIKQPCILIFDSLAGASRSRVVATLRDYLKCEYKAKMNTERIFNKDTIKCACPKVPQQTNFTDCGLYLLQYVESFFTDPVIDYRLPIYQLKDWFEEITVTKKREDISKLIIQLMVQYNKDPSILPDIIFPTLNGKLLPRIEEDEEDEEFEEEEEEEEEEEDEELLDEDTHEHAALLSSNIELFRDAEPVESMDDEYEGSIIKPSSVSHNENFDEQTITLIKPDISEVKKNSRDALSYLRAKRIIKHKSNECSDPKKFKSTETV